MSRLNPIDRDRLDAEARTIYDHIGLAHNGYVRGPWPIELRVPVLADLCHKMYDRLCVDTTLGKRLFELMVIVVARHWKSQFEYWAHEQAAITHGITPEVAHAIRHNRPPPFTLDDEKLVYALTREINERTTLSDESYARGMAFFGEVKLVEFTLALGFYTMLAIHLNVFQADIPSDAEPLV